MWYVLLKQLLSATLHNLLLLCLYEQGNCVRVCVSVKPNPSWNADLMIV